MRKLLILFSILICLVMANGVFACVCYTPETPKKALKWSEAVFTGEVLDFRKEDYSALFTIKVEMVWKGVSEKQLVLVDSTYGSDCSSELKLGQRYIIFASYKRYDTPEPEGKYLSLDKNGKPQPVIDTCSWSANLASKGVEQKILKKIGKGRIIK